MKSQIIAASFSATMWVLSGTAHAEECSDALIVSTYAADTELSSDYRLATSLTETQFNELKRSSKAGAEIFGIGGGDASYDEYKTASQERIQTRDEKLSVYQKENMLWTGLGPESLAAYQACLRTKYGLFLYAESATKSLVSLVLEYNPTTNQDLDLSWANPPPGVTLPSKISPGEKVSLVVQRPSVGDADLSFAPFGGQVRAPTLYVTAYPPPPVGPVWQHIRVGLGYMAHPAGSTELGNGYTATNIRYFPVNSDIHGFLFDIVGGDGLVKDEVQWQGRNSGTYDATEVQVDGRGLLYGFSSWNDGSGLLHFKWK